jgi:hypothetical protein
MLSIVKSIEMYANANQHTGTSQTYLKHLESYAAKHHELPANKPQPAYDSHYPTSSHPTFQLQLPPRGQHSSIKSHTFTFLKMRRINHHSTDRPAAAKARNELVNTSTGTRDIMV